MILNEERNVTLTAYLQPAGGEFRNISRRPAVLILPGGGYTMCSDRETDPVAFPYLKAGYQTFILRYSVGEHATWPNPLEDYEKAMELIRSNEEKWSLYPDKIAVIGFSAGGHLAASAAVMSKNRPNAAILGYPVIDKETVSTYLPSAPDAAEAVDDNTCPCFLFASRNDSTVPVKNTIKMMEALTKYDISFESHIYAYAPHGFTTGDTSVAAGFDCCSRVPRWVEDSLEWLKDVLGDFGNQEMTEPKCKARINGNRDPFYNPDCTMGYLLKDKEVKDLLLPYFQPMMEHMHVEEIPDMVNTMLLKDILGFMNFTTDKLQEISDKLKNIPKNR